MADSTANISAREIQRLIQNKNFYCRLLREALLRDYTALGREWRAATFKVASRSKKIGEDGKICSSLSCLSSFTRDPTFCGLNWVLFILNKFSHFLFDSVRNKLV